MIKQSIEQTREFLKQYKSLTIKIKQLEQEIIHKEIELDAISINCDGMPHGSNISKITEQRAVILSDEKIKLENLKLEAELKRDGIRDVIGALQNDTSKEILYRKYIELKNNFEIAGEMNYSERWVMWKHKRALVEINNILNKTLH